MHYGKLVADQLTFIQTASIRLRLRVNDSTNSTAPILVIYWIMGLNAE